MSVYADSLVKDIREAAIDSMALDLHVAKEGLSFDDFMLTRLGLCRYSRRI